MISFITPNWKQLIIDLEKKEYCRERDFVAPDTMATGNPVRLSNETGIKSLERELHDHGWTYTPGMDRPEKTGHAGSR